MDRCKICKSEETDDIELGECDNCSEIVCSACCVSISGGAPEGTFWICNDCATEMTYCIDCDGLIPNEELKVCEKCNESVCYECLSQHNCRA